MARWSRVLVLAGVSSAPPTKVIVYLAFVRDEEGELQPAFEAREAQFESAAPCAGETARAHYSASPMLFDVLSVAGY